MTVVLVGKPDCHLCDQARAVVSDVCTKRGVPWREASILDDPELADQYWELIPVVLVGGVQIAHWRIDPDVLTAALASPILNRNVPTGF